MEEALDVITTKVESTEDIPLLVQETPPLWTNAAHVPRITYRIYIYRYTRLCIELTGGLRCIPSLIGVIYIIQ